jgi:hypothetical protein
MPINCLDRTTPRAPSKQPAAAFSGDLPAGSFAPSEGFGGRCCGSSPRCDFSQNPGKLV